MKNSRAMYAFVAFVVIMVLVCMTRKAKEMFEGSYTVDENTRCTGKQIIEKDGKYAHTVENISDCEEICNNTDENCEGFNSWVHNGDLRCAFQGPGCEKESANWASYHEKKAPASAGGAPFFTDEYTDLGIRKFKQRTCKGATMMYNEASDDKDTAIEKCNKMKDCVGIYYRKRHDMNDTWYYPLKSDPTGECEVGEYDFVEDNLYVRKPATQPATPPSTRPTTGGYVKMDKKLCDGGIIEYRQNNSGYTIFTNDKRNYPALVGFSAKELAEETCDEEDECAGIRYAFNTYRPFALENNECEIKDVELGTLYLKKNIKQIYKN